MNYLSGNLIYLRRQKGLSEEELSRHCGLNTPIEHIELGTIEPTMDELVCMSEFFHIPVDRLLREDLALCFDKLNDFRLGLLALDIDGVMTDGGMFYTQSGDEFKKFNAKDGLAIKTLTAAGVQVAFISSGINDRIIQDRAKLLGVKHVYVGTWKKLEILEDWCAKMSIGLEQVAYIGDDVNDAAVIQKVGFSACPSDAVAAIRQIVDVVLDSAGGKGCVREFVERFIRPLGE